VVSSSIFRKRGDRNAFIFVCGPDRTKRKVSIAVIGKIYW